MDIIKQFYKLNTLQERNIWFGNFMEDKDIESLSADMIFDLFGVCFQLFKENFENNNDNYYTVAEKCECLLNRYLHLIDLNKFNNNEDVLYSIMDIVCFVYELTYRYEEEINILKMIIHIKNISNHLKVRAISNMLFTAKSTALLDDAETQKYSDLMNSLSL